MGGGEGRVWKVLSVRNMVHAEVKPDHQVFLVEGLVVDVGAEVDNGVKDVQGVVGVCRGCFFLLALSNPEMFLSPLGGFVEVCGSFDGDMGRRRHGCNTVGAVFTVLVLFLLIDDVDLFIIVVRPVNPRFFLNIPLLQLHRIPGSFAPAIRLLRWDEFRGRDGVRGSENVEICLKVKYMVMHRSRKEIVDLVAVVVVGCEIRGLDITRCTDFDADGTVEVEGVLEHVVVVSDGGDGPDDKVDVFGHRDVTLGGVTGDRVACVSFKNANRAGVGARLFAGVEGGVEVSCVGGTIVTLDKLEGVRTEAIECVEIGSSRLGGIVTSVMGESFH